MISALSVDKLFKGGKSCKADAWLLDSKWLAFALALYQIKLLPSQFSIAECKCRAAISFYRSINTFQSETENIHSNPPILLIWLIVFNHTCHPCSHSIIDLLTWLWPQVYTALMFTLCLILSYCSHSRNTKEAGLDLWHILTVEQRQWVNNCNQILPVQSILIRKSVGPNVKKRKK